MSRPNTHNVFFVGVVASLLALLTGCGSGPKAWKGQVAVTSVGKSFMGAFAASQIGSDSKVTDDIQLSCGAEIKIQEVPSRSCYALNLTIGSLSIRQNGTQIESTAEAVKSLNGQTFYFSTDSQNRVEFIYALSDRDIIPILVVRTILSHWMGQKPAPGVRYETEASGKYLVKYSESAKNEWIRDLLEFQVDHEQFVAMPGRSVVKPDTNVKGQSKILFDKEGYVSEVDSNRDTTSKFANRIVSQSSEHIGLRLTESGAREKIEVPDLNVLSKLPIIARTDATESERALQAKELGNLNLDEILNLVPPKWTDNNERTKIFLKLRAHFYLRPESCAQVVQLTPLSPTAGQLVIDALAATGSKEAQKSLIILGTRHSTDSAYIQQILVSLTQLPKPTSELQAFVCRLAQNANQDRPIKYTAQLVCGSLAHRLSSSDATRSSSLNAFLDDQLKDAATDDDRLNLLYAIGNAARPEPSQSIVAFLRSTNPVLRAGAIHALRLTPGKNVDQIIADQLETEQVASVKKEARRVMDARKLAPNNPN